MIGLTKGLVLRKIGEEDFEPNWDGLMELRNDVDTALMILSRPLGQNRQDIRRWIAGRNEMPDCIFFGIFEGERLVGYVIFIEECRISGVGEVGVTLMPADRGKGFGSCALGGFLDYLHKALDYRKFVARIIEGNDGSVKIFEANGFVLVGAQKNHRRFSGRYHSIGIYEKIVGDL